MNQKELYDFVSKLSPEEIIYLLYGRQQQQQKIDYLLHQKYYFS